MSISHTNPAVSPPFIELPVVDSTNNYAMHLLQQGAVEHGTAYFAHEQTDGKGTRGKVWKSMPNQNIILSVVLDTSELAVSSQFYVSAAIAVAVCNFLRKYAGEKVFIKWPNDIFLNDRKAAGILIENSIRGNVWQYAVAGIGVNVNQKNFESFPHATSLSLVEGKIYDVITLAREIQIFVLENFSALLQNGFEKALSNYNRLLYKKEKKVFFKQEEKLFSGIIKSVNEKGELLLAESNIKKLCAGEAEWIFENNL